MKNKFYFPYVFVVAVFVLAACNSADHPVSSENHLQTSESRQETTEDLQVATENTQETPALSDGPVFQAGTWLLVTGDRADTYYFFDADGTSGHTASQVNGMGIGFTYSVEGSQAVFYMGSSDNPASCTLQKTDSGQITVKWEDGREETLIFISEKGSDSFRFYSNDALCDLAINYYFRAGGETENITAAAVTNEDGSVTIQVFENLGDHNSTCAWYCVDRCTGKGTDLNTGEEVDFGVSGQE